MTEVHLLNQELETLKIQTEIMLENNSQIILMVDKNLIITMFNSAFQEMHSKVHGLPLVTGKNILDCFPKTKQEHFKKIFDLALEGKFLEHNSSSMHEKDQIAYKMHLKPIFNNNNNNNNNEITGIFVSGTKLLNLSQIDEEYDCLTFLSNRAVFMDSLKRAVDAQIKPPFPRFAVLFIDVDKFKTVNDNLGHSVGDSLLNEVAKKLLACTNNKDVVSRLGGDEFTILLHNISSRRPVEVAKLIQKSIKDGFLIDKKPVSITLSIGIRESNQLFDKPEDILKEADNAMYKAKSAGRNNYRVFNHQMRKVFLSKLSLEQDLIQTLTSKQDELELYYQPILNLENGLARRCEALIRWKHPKLGLLLPKDFLPIAQEQGLISQIDNFVIKKACQQNAEWFNNKLNPITICVNLSVAGFKQRNIASQSKKYIEHYNINPNLLEFELTEDVMINDKNSTLKELHRLRDMGINISIDDFGTGYSSFSYLKKLPISIIKIDRSFVHDLVTDNGSRAIVISLITLAHNLNLKVVAEGVETKEQLSFLRSFGCDFVQGFYIGRPMPAKQLVRILEKIS